MTNSGEFLKGENFGGKIHLISTREISKFHLVPINYTGLKGGMLQIGMMMVKVNPLPSYLLQTKPLLIIS